MSDRRRSMRYEAMAIQGFLATHHGLRVRCTGGRELPRYREYQFATAADVRLRRVQALAGDLARYLSVGEEQCMVDQRGPNVTIRVPRRDMSVVHLRALMDEIAGDVPDSACVLGRDHEGCPLLVRLASPEVAHIMIAGQTGTGKTVLARAMIASLVRWHSVRDLSVILIDPKGHAYRPFAGLPHLPMQILTDVDDVLAAVRWLVSVMKERDEQIAAGKPLGPRLVVFIDELADLISEAAELVALLTRLSQRGREAGIHLVASTQKPSAEVVGSLLKANFPVRIALRVGSPEDARVALGVKGSGAERLLGLGDAVMQFRGYLHRFQSAYIEEAEIADLVTRLRGGEPAMADAGGSLPDNVLVFRRREPASPATAQVDEEALRRDVLAAMDGEMSFNQVMRRHFGYVGGQAFEAVKRIRTDLERCYYDAGEVTDLAMGPNVRVSAS